MKYCHKCQMNMLNELTKCPLCNESLEEVGPSQGREYPLKFVRKKRFPIIRMTLFISMIIISYSIIVGLFQDFNWDYIFIITGATAYLCLSVVFSLKVSRNLGPMIVVQVMFLSLLALLIDYTFGYSKWSINYVFPIAIMTGTLVLTLRMILQPKKFSDTVVYQLLLTLLGVICAILVVFHVVTFEFIAVLAGYYTIITFLGMFIFGDQKMVHELKKKFHI
ncbi:MAG TPA: hypothetical protein DCY20_06365 [Firmicutes bacterium]|nr:hypothetical protein [Bacillota bacterium]